MSMAIQYMTGARVDCAPLSDAFEYRTGRGEAVTQETQPSRPEHRGLALSNKNSRKRKNKIEAMPPLSVSLIYFFHHPALVERKKLFSQKSCAKGAARWPLQSTRPSTV